MTADKIREIALRHFTRNGYEGASLADISSDVGIKKQSIYNYFKGKEELFLAVFRDAAARELDFVQEYLKRGGLLALDKLLLGFLLAYKTRYEMDDDTKFFLRMSFFPPERLRHETVECSIQYLDQMAELLGDVFQSAAETGQIHPDVPVEHAAEAFIAVLDGVFVEMLYGGEERSRKRLDASWPIFWRGIKNN